MVICGKLLLWENAEPIYSLVVVVSLTEDKWIPKSWWMIIKLLSVVLASFNRDTASIMSWSMKLLFF